MSDFTVSSSWGVSRIAAERQRQIVQEGFDQDHDNTKEGAGQMALAAACYAASAAGVGVVFEEGDPRNGPQELWPWSEDWDKREKHSKIRQLEIAGALIAAELDRLRNAGE